MSNGVRYTPTFAMPTEYERAAMEARRRQRMAEMLAQQAYTPQDIGSAPIPRAAPLVQGLQAFLTARQQRKAEEAEKEAKGIESEYARRLAGRMGGVSELPNYGTPEQQAARIDEEEAAQRASGQLQEVTPTAQYRFNPQEALEMASTEVGTAALKNRPLMAARLAKMLEKPAAEEFGTTPVKGADGYYYIQSKSGRLVKTDVLFPKDESIKPLLTPAQIADLRLKYGTAVVDRALGLSGLSPDVHSSIPNLPSFESLLAPLPSGMPSARGADLETGEFTPGRGLRYSGQATTATGEPVSGNQKPAIERVSPKAYGEMVAKQPTDKRAAQNALGQISMMRNFIQDLQQHGGTDYIFGPIASITPDIRGSATSARSLFDTLRERSSVESLKQSRAEGFAPGSITEQEWPRFETAIGAIRGAKDPRAMRIALENASAQLQDIERRILSNYQGTYGSKFPLEWSPAPYKPESSLYPTPKVQSEDQAVFDEADRLILEMQRRRAPRGK